MKHITSLIEFKYLFLAADSGPRTNGRRILRSFCILEDSERNDII